MDFYLTHICRMEIPFISIGRVLLQFKECQLHFGWKFLLAYSGEPGQMPHSVMSYMGLQFSNVNQKRVPGLYGVS